MFCRFGFPRVIILDQGREFCNKLSDGLFQLSNTQHRITSPYHPQSNGLTERFNQTLTNSLRAKINAEQNDWDLHLNLILFSYRATTQASTQYSPYHSMFGREPIFPIDTEVLLSDLSPAEPDQFENVTKKEVTTAIDSLHSFQKEMYSAVSENIADAQKKQKNYYDSRHQPQIFSVGEKVLVENTAQKIRKGGKLEDKWLGPYKINREIRSGAYALETIDGKLLKKSCNVARLKVFHEEVSLKSEDSKSSDRPSGLPTASEDVMPTNSCEQHPCNEEPPPGKCSVTSESVSCACIITMIIMTVMHVHAYILH